MKYRIMAFIALLIMIGLTISSAGGEPNPYRINSFGTLDELKSWVNTISAEQAEELDRINLNGDAADITKYMKGKGVPVPKINSADGSEAFITNISLYYEIYSTRGRSGLWYSLEYNGENAGDILLDISIISDEQKTWAQEGILEYCKKSEPGQNYYERKTAVFSRNGCSINCRIRQDKVEQISVGGKKTEMLIRTYETGWGKPDGNRVTFIYNDFLVSINNLADLDLLNELSIEVEIA